MKKILSILLLLFAASSFVFAEEADEYDDGYVYEANGSGDQYLLIGLMPFIPLNFGDKVFTGGAAELGYYRFLSKNFAVGGELNATFNMTLGGNSLTTVPITFGCIFQPVIGRFEIPLSLSAGIAYETAQNSSYFPGLAVKGGVSCFYRVTEMWSFGVDCKALWLPQWFSKKEYNDNAFFLAPAVCARYHF